MAAPSPLSIGAAVLVASDGKSSGLVQRSEAQIIAAVKQLSDRTAQEIAPCDLPAYSLEATRSLAHD